ncbi:MAG: hypothetical protein WDN06_02905 [Asticcacaulis sp.]
MVKLTRSCGIGELILFTLRKLVISVAFSTCRIGVGISTPVHDLRGLAALIFYWMDHLGVCGGRSANFSEQKSHFQ